MGDRQRQYRDHPTSPRARRGRYSRRTFLGLTAGFGLLAACQPASPQGSPQAGPTGAAATGAAATGRPRKPTMLVALDNDIDNMDIYPFVSDASYALRMSVHTRLLQLPLEAGPNGTLVQKGHTPVGLIAESYESTPDGKVWRYRLRKDVKTSTGTTLTAEDAKYSYERGIQLGGSLVSLNRLLTTTKAEQLRVVDAQTFEETLDRPLAFAAKLHAVNNRGILLSKQVMSQNATASDPWATAWGKNNIIGAGPYQLEKWTPGSEFRLNPNPNYFRAEDVANDGVVGRFLPNAQDRLLLLKRGDVDLAMGFLPKDLPDLEKDPNVTVHAISTVATNYLGMNNKIAPFNNPKVRQAVSLAIPYQTIVEKALYGYADRLVGPVPSSMVGFDRNAWGQVGYETNPEKAKGLLRDAGYANGFKVDLAVLAGKTDWIDAAVWIQSALKPIGIEVNLTPISDAQFFDKFNKKELPFFIHFFRGWVNDAGYHMWLMFHSRSAINPVVYANSQVDALLDGILSEADSAKRTSMMSEAQRLILQDAPWGFLFSQKHIIATRKNVSGLALLDDLMFRFEFLTKK